MSEDRVILIDKPLQWTSFDVVRAVRRNTGIRKTGHAGTLDPLATGLLILCTGRATKKITALQEQEKEYVGEITLGQTTPSCDAETLPTSPVTVTHIAPEDIRRVANRFVGEIEQIPPPYSAIKINGTRAYKLARKGINPHMKARKIYIRHFDILAHPLPKVRFRVVCSKGAYMRSLARDVGEALGVGGYLSKLRRTRIGSYLVQDAVSIDRLAP